VNKTYAEDSEIVLVGLVEDIKNIADPGNQADHKINQHIRQHKLEVVEAIKVMGFRG
jgi:hypothetical protein